MNPEREPHTVTAGHPGRRAGMDPWEGIDWELLPSAPALRPLGGDALEATSPARIALPTATEAIPAHPRRRRPMPPAVNPEDLTWPFGPPSDEATAPGLQASALITPFRPESHPLKAKGSLRPPSPLAGFHDPEAITWPFGLPDEPHAGLPVAEPLPEAAVANVSPFIQLSDIPEVTPWPFEHLEEPEPVLDRSHRVHRVEIPGVPSWSMEQLEAFLTSDDGAMEPEPAEDDSEVTDNVRELIDGALARLAKAMDLIPLAPHPEFVPVAAPVVERPAARKPLPEARRSSRSYGKALAVASGILLLVTGGALLDRFVLLKVLPVPPGTLPAPAQTQQAAATPGPSVPPTLADFWQRALAGDRNAMRMLSVCFSEGLGVQRDPQAAEHWQRMAEAQEPRTTLASASPEPSPAPVSPEPSRTPASPDPTPMDQGRP